MTDDERKLLSKRLAEMRKLLAEREAALPKHSVRPHQLLAIEELEEEIAEVEKQLSGD